MRPDICVTVLPQDAHRRQQMNKHVDCCLIINMAMQGDNFCAQMHIPAGFRTFAPDLKICFWGDSLENPFDQVGSRKQKSRQTSKQSSYFMARHDDMPAVSGTTGSWCLRFPHSMLAPSLHRSELVALKVSQLCEDLRFSLTLWRLVLPTVLLSIIGLFRSLQVQATRCTKFGRGTGWWHCCWQEPWVSPFQCLRRGRNMLADKYCRLHSRISIWLWINESCHMACGSCLRFSVGELQRKDLQKIFNRIDVDGSG
jgi:hypothetical protein